MAFRGMLIIFMVVAYLGVLVRGAIAIYEIIEGHNGLKGWVAIAAIAIGLGIAGLIAMVIFTILT